MFVSKTEGVGGSVTKAAAAPCAIADVLFGKIGKDDVYTRTRQRLRVCSHKTTYTTVASPQMFGLQNNNVKFCSSNWHGSQIAYKIGFCLSRSSFAKDDDD